MPARLVLNQKELRPNGLIIQRVIWLLPEPVPPCTHRYKYSLFCGFSGTRIIAYDNERGKGDHVHRFGREVEYHFASVRRLIEDFNADVARLAQQLGDEG